jgi:hypothetical protein
MGEPEQPQQGGGIQWIDAGQAGVTTETLPRHMKFVRVATNELDDLKSSNSTLELAFFGISLGAIVTIICTLKTVQMDAATHTIFVSVSWVFGLAAAYFGLATLRGELRWRRKINGLKRGALE